MALSCNLHHQMRKVLAIQNAVLTNETRTRNITLWSLHRLKMCKSASIMTRLWTGWQGFDAWLGQRFFSLLHHLGLLWGVPSPYQMDTGVSFPGSKAAEAWIWPCPYITEVKNARIYALVFPYVLNWSQDCFTLFYVLSYEACCCSVKFDLFGSSLFCIIVLLLGRTTQGRKYIIVEKSNFDNAETGLVQ